MNRIARDALTAEQIADHRKSAIEWCERIGHDISTWDIETVKHLALANIAGLAGAAGLAASATYGTTRHPAMFCWFGAGLIFAVLNLYLGTWGYRLMAREIMDRIVNMDASPEFDMMTLFSQRSGRAKLCGDAGVFAGWISAIAGVIGIVSLAVVVF